MRASLLALVAALGSGACATETPVATAPWAPSFTARASAPSVFVVDVSRDTTAQNETPVAVNPRNAGNLLTGANDWNYNDGCAYNVSFNGGRTWSSTLPDGFIPGLTRFTNDPSVPGTGAYEAAGDPAVQIALYVSRSTDGGRTWPDGVRDKPAQVSTWNGNGKSKGSTGQVPDHDAIAVDDNPGSPFAGSVYVT